ncbi:alpha/beta hydrolase [Bacillus thuringiensis]|uniref:Alpha/beta hydrolase n=1 Tax=Bacillus thuringiensis TaxID=1428 RepID=A0A9W3TD67_BACTU|nr:alpha/beta hydrolase [Bacillus thuringiensis]AQY39127.1 alpha/beta hydrolase [Bacillus thuringiensis]MDR4151272.1 alpha/beta hydrolase [Bacillus thuringiensis]MEC3573798.1 alpha/beta hydrolase [Bacillus thuringiensis]MED2022413.1 alpha/beta hydrolase [Bacillus thuringiensis]MED2143652.1 alpha/beta hydrolase [Bacillus thuringiensis]
MNKWIKITLYSLLGILIMGSITFLTWSQFTYKPTKEALSLVDDKKDEDNIIFGQKDAIVGVIFYQGAKVEVESYSYLGEALAKDGQFVVMPKLPLNLAILGTNVVDSVIEKYSDVQKWYVAGHSMGGAMISRYAFQHEEKVDGIILLGSYPADDFSTKRIPMLSIYGEVDGLATVEKIKSSKKFMSKNTTMHMIKGGNHANFGMYGKQKGGLIAPKVQRDETVRVIEEWLVQQK